MRKWFPCITIFRERGGRFIKGVKKCICVIVLKIALLLVKNVFIIVKKRMSELWRWVVAKHTTFIEIFTLNFFSNNKVFSI